MNVLAVIPARLGSTRLPNKPLQLLLGEPLIAHTFRAVSKCMTLDRIVVATDTQAVADAVEKVGGTALITPADLATGTDRVAFVARELPQYDVVLNIQGDEPMIRPSMIDKLIEPFREDPTTKMSTIACPLDWDHEYTNPDHVKVLLDHHQRALTFSRSPVPYRRESSEPIDGVYKHMGAYGFAREFLLEFTQLPPTSFEEAEKLEQLRAMQHGIAIDVRVVPERTVEVNRADELIAAEQAMRTSQATSDP